MSPTPVVIDTDLGTDIDDTWAIAQALRSTELDLRLVTTVSGDARYRARATAALLAAAGRSDVPVAAGIGGHGRDGRPQQQLAEASPTATFADGVEALVEACREPVTIIAIGPLTNLAAALRRDPSIAERARVVAMCGSVHVGYRGVPGAVAEYNAATDVAAVRTVLEAAWDVLLTPLDTCATVVLRGDAYERVRGAADRDPLLAALFGTYREWLESNGRTELLERRSTTLYDCVAVHLAHDESLWEIDEVALAIADDGVMRLDGVDGSTVRAALRWRDQHAFEERLVATLVSGAERSRWFRRPANG